jgi:hypothetical protein
VISRIRDIGHAIWRNWHLRDVPQAARAQLELDLHGLPATGPDVEQCIDAGMKWLALAHDKNRLKDGGVARVYSLIDGWSASYPETTGYIVPTFLAMSKRYSRPDWEERAQHMLVWLMRIQMHSGAYQGGQIDSIPMVPVAFNTGQILIGLAMGERVFGNCRSSLVRAADWLVSIQEADGSWKKGASPFAIPGEYTYSTHIGWGLVEAARVTGDSRYADAALKNAQWALKLQNRNGWLPLCCLSDPSEPLTHTLGYALRGLLEVYRYHQTEDILDGANKLATGVMSALSADGWLPGQLKSDWSSSVSWSCLTGTIQNAHNWLLLFQITGDERYLAAGRLANLFVRRSMIMIGPPELVGAVRGSFPINGNYCRFQYPNWAVKFMVDSLVLEQDIAAGLPFSRG